MSQRWRRTHVCVRAEESALCGAKKHSLIERAGWRVCTRCIDLLVSRANRNRRSADALLAGYDSLTLALNVAADKGKRIGPKHIRAMISEAEVALLRARAE